MARELEIEVKADTREAEAALARVEKTLQDIEKAGADADKVLRESEERMKQQAKAANEAAKESDKLAEAIKKYAGPLVIIEATRRTLAWVDSLEELSQQTGFTVESIQKIGKVAERAGSSIEQVAAAVAQMDNRLAKGDKTASAAIRNIGLSVEALLKLQPEQRFVEISKAIGSIEDPAKRTQAAIAVFGRSGAALIPTMRDIAKGAHETGLVLSDEFVSAGARAQDQLDQLMQTGKVVLAYFLTWPAVLGQWAGEVGLSIRAGFASAWQGAKEFMVGGVPLPSLPGSPGSVAGQIGRNGALPVPGLPDNIGGIERELTAAVRQNTIATERNSTALEMSAADELLDRSQWNAWQIAARGPLNVPIPGIGPGTFPGWAIPDPLRNSMNLGGPENWNGTGAWMLRQPVVSNMPSDSGRGGLLSRLEGLFSGRFGGVAAQGLGMLSGLIPGMSNKGSSIGSLAGSLLGPLGSIGGGLIGGLFGKLFGGDKDKKELSAARGTDEFKSLVAAAREAGLSVDQLFSTKKVKDFQGAVADLQDQLSEQAADTDRLRSAMDKYGFSIADMGQKFKQTEISKGFKELGDDFRVLIGAGAEFTKVAEKMAPEFGNLIQTAIETGTTVPRELEPILRQMIEMGVLVDRNGDKFTDLTQIPFAESMTEGFDKVVKAIEKLSAAIRGVAGDFDAAADAAGNFGEAAASVPSGPGGGGGSDDSQTNVARGGVIRGRGDVLYFRRGGFVPSGTDTVPAMLTPGEMVLSRDVVKNFASLGATMPEIINGSLEDVVRSVATVGAKGGDASESGNRASGDPLARTQPVPVPGGPRESLGGSGMVRPQPVPFERQTGGDVVLISVPSNVDAAGIADMVEKRLGRSIPGNRNRLRDMLDQLYVRRGPRRVA